MPFKQSEEMREFDLSQDYFDVVSTRKATIITLIKINKKLVIFISFVQSKFYSYLYCTIDAIFMPFFVLYFHNISLVIESYLY